MKLNLFLLASIFTVLHLCKAGPLRLHKRAAFYIANETACVVDNIVYSSGDPIPTDDPCETCKCRPPGFACMFKECRIKPGCRAVRQAGQCCPEYVCGCEHNGRMYQDGEEIRDAKNPCYICHCQGSSIACAFVECFFRSDCPPVYVPGECCPQYPNCTRDIPENRPFNENNAVPSLLLPSLNDESVIPVNVQTTVKELSSVIPTNPPTQPSVEDKNEGVTTAKITPSTYEPNEFPTAEPVSSVPVETKVDPVIEEKSSEQENVPSDINKDGEIKDEKVEGIEEVLLNSETEIKKEDKVLTTTVKYEEPVTDKSKDVFKPTIENVANVINDAESTEKTSEIESSGTEIPVTVKQVKNSAADNSKSLKLSDDEVLAVEPQNKTEKIEEIQTEAPKYIESKLGESVTELPTESSSNATPVNVTESKPVSEENVAEESQAKPQSTLYNSSDKIKSETAETVTIVVHVVEKAKTTEKDLILKETTPASAASTTQESLLKSNELKSTEQPIEEKISTLAGTTYESAHSSTAGSKNELTTETTLPDKSLKDVESRSEKTEEISDAEENPVSEKIFDSSTKKESLTTTTSSVSITDPKPAEVRSDEVTTEGLKTDEPKITTIEEEKPNTDVKIKIATDSDTERNVQNSTENESKHVITTEETKTEKSVEEIKPEIREDDSNVEEKEAITAKTEQETTSTEKLELTSPQTEVLKPKIRAEETESGEKSENIEKKIVETHEQNSEVTTESKAQETGVSAQTDIPKNHKE